ncbi:unnamed protein product [Lymnaea stagnalis]|uniref:Chromo domain-containing protein n=1 Tax=Lymnaea stagnalis TaxID=6523 RepID=A0AAV2HES5_LYMST
MAEEQLYEVEQILGKKVLSSRHVLYLVRWRGFSSDHDSWEPFGNLKACKPLTSMFNRHLEEFLGKTPMQCGTQVMMGENGPEISSLKHTKKGEKLFALKKTNLLENVKVVSSAKLTSGETLMKKKVKNIKRNSTNVLPSETNFSPSEGNINKTEGQNKTSYYLQTGCIIEHLQKKKLTVKRKAENEGSNSKSTPKAKRPKKTNNEAVLTNVKFSVFNAVGVKKAEGEVDENDDDILYSLNPKCDILEGGDSIKKSKINSKKVIGTDRKDSMRTKSSVIYRKNSSGMHSREGLKKNTSKRKKINLIDSKRKSKYWLSKSGLLQSESTPPHFTTVKHDTGSPATQDPSIPSGESLSDPVSPEASETYLADVPTSYPLPALEPVVNDQPLSPASLSYKSLLDCLPAQLHPSHKGDKKNKSLASSGSSSSLLGASLTSSLSTETVERRTSVRSTECAFRYKQIVVKKCFRYTQIWLNTQTVMKNALNPQVIQEVVSALNSAKYDDSHLVLFSSLGNVFCSGTDLHFLVSGERKMSARQMTDAIRELTKTFITFPKPIIAAVSGAVVGLGVSLLALCDVVYASDKASFHLPYSQLSQTPEGCSSFTLPLTVGLPSANELLYGGRKITAMEAYQQGLISQVFWPTLMMQEVIPRAQNMAACSAKALEATKLLVRSHHRTKMELTNETECNLLFERWTSADCQRAIEAYLSIEKNWTF